MHAKKAGAVSCQHRSVLCSSCHARTKHKKKQGIKCLYAVQAVQAGLSAARIISSISIQQAKLRRPSVAMAASYHPQASSNPQQQCLTRCSRQPLSCPAMQSKLQRAVQGRNSLHSNQLARQTKAKIKAAKPAVVMASRATPAAPVGRT